MSHADQSQQLQHILWLRAGNALAHCCSNEHHPTPHDRLCRRDVEDGTPVDFIERLQKDMAAIQKEHGCDAQIASGGGRMRVTMDRYEVCCRLPAGSSFMAPIQAFNPVSWETCQIVFSGAIDPCWHSLIDVCLRTLHSSVGPVLGRTCLRCGAVRAQACCGGHDSYVPGTRNCSRTGRLWSAGGRRTCWARRSTPSRMPWRASRR
jgi:hypothetical protein